MNLNRISILIGTKQQFLKFSSYNSISRQLKLIIIYFENVHFFHAKLGLDVCLYEVPYTIHISLKIPQHVNQAPSHHHPHIHSKSSCSLPLPPPHFNDKNNWYNSYWNFFSCLDETLTALVIIATVLESNTLWLESCRWVSVLLHLSGGTIRQWSISSIQKFNSKHILPESFSIFSIHCLCFNQFDNTVAPHKM